MRTQRGNILFLILLAIILFVALSYAVTSGMRGGGNNANAESNQAAVADIANFLVATENAVNRMRTVKDLKPEAISFEYMYQQYNGTKNLNFVNANCTSDDCRLFKPSGGGIEPRTFEKYALPDPPGITASNIKPGYFAIILMQFPYAGTDANDIVLQIAFIRQEICQEYNNRMGIAANPSLTGTWVPANNVANWDNTAYTLSNNVSSVIGKSSFAAAPFNGHCTINLLLLAR